jgi:hypothetical protein
MICHARFSSCDKALLALSLLMAINTEVESMSKELSKSRSCEPTFDADRRGPNIRIQLSAISNNEIERTLYKLPNYSMFRRGRWCSTEPMMFYTEQDIIG